LKVRKAHFAGSWYPSDPRACRSRIESFLLGAPSPEGEGAEAVGGIVPHAGWDFSGRIAARVMALMARGEPPSTVVIFGGHLGPWSKSRVMAEGAWDTPFGPIEVDSLLARELMKRVPIDQESPTHGEPDNTIEVQLPIIKHLFPGTKILPIWAPPTPQGLEIGRACGGLVRELGKRCLVLGSTDLTHYGPGYGFRPAGSGSRAESFVREVSDKAIIEKILEMRPEGIIEEALAKQNACCPGAAAAALACGLELGAKKAQLVEYSTSLDVMRGEDFVGYAGIVLWS
jgi:AmmeMemoRadiSam system protein B